jgi:ribosomal protein S18 acetylase RimI-like enzyme
LDILKSQIVDYDGTTSSRKPAMPSITLETGRAISAQQLASVFARSGINRRTGDLAHMQKMVDTADHLVTAWDGEVLVGVSRSLTDYCELCYLADLAVDREYQKLGIGRRLVEQVRRDIGVDVHLLLLSAPTAMSYYPKIGLDPCANAFIIKRPA